MDVGERDLAHLDKLGPAARQAFLDSYPLNVRPVTDDRPFFFHHYRWVDLLSPKTWEIDVGFTLATGQRWAWSSSRLSSRLSRSNAGSSPGAQPMAPRLRIGPESHRP